MPEDKVSVKSLLELLAKEKDVDKKRNIRARLRAMGHKGGLGQPRGPRTKKTAIPKKGKRAVVAAGA